MRHNVIHLRTTEAAALLNIDPATLRDWEERLGFPTSRTAASGHRQFVWGEIIALRTALLSEHSVAAAIATARAAVTDVSADALYAEFITMNRSRCDQALDSALNLRSVEGAVEEVLVRALDLLARTHRPDSPEWGFAADFSGHWLRHTIQHTVAPRGGGSILVGNACRDELDQDAVYVSSLELLCRRTGCDVHTVSVREPADIYQSVAVGTSDVLLIAGGQTADEIVIRWAHEARRAVSPSATAFYRRDPWRPRFIPDAGGTLPSDPLAARGRLLELIELAHPPA